MSKGDKRYQVDHESLGARRCQNDIALFLAQETSNPNFSLRRVCDNCVGWTPARGLAKKPLRPFAGTDFDSCSGCAYSYLDQAKPEKEERPSPPRRRVRSWKQDGHTKKQYSDSVKEQNQRRSKGRGPATSKASKPRKGKKH